MILSAFQLRMALNSLKFILTKHQHKKKVRKINFSRTFNNGFLPLSFVDPVVQVLIQLNNIPSL